MFSITSLSVAYNWPTMTWNNRKMNIRCLILVVFHSATTYNLNQMRIRTCLWMIFKFLRAYSYWSFTWLPSCNDLFSLNASLTRRNAYSLKLRENDVELHHIVFKFSHFSTCNCTLGISVIHAAISCRWIKHSALSPGWPWCVFLQIIEKLVRTKNHFNE